MKTERMFGRGTRQTEETDKFIRHLAEFAGMSAECRGDVSHPAESGQYRFKALEPNFVFVAKCSSVRVGYRQHTGKFCRLQPAQPSIGCTVRSFPWFTYRSFHRKQTSELALQWPAERNQTGRPDAHQKKANRIRLNPMASLSPAEVGQFLRLPTSH